jgi:hypothetical protein
MRGIETEWVWLVIRPYDSKEHVRFEVFTAVTMKNAE